MSKVTTFNADGMVKTGFSLPYVALYAEDGVGGISFSNGMKLARGVSADLQPTVQDETFFSADNGAAESDGGQVTAGTLALTVDGLLPAAYNFVTGMTAKGENEDWQDVGDNASAGRPYVAIGYIMRFKCAGVTMFTPLVIVRAKYAESNETSNTAEYNAPINWQTAALNFNFFRANDTNHTWKKTGDFYTTEAEAEAVIKTLFGIA